MSALMNLLNQAKSQAVSARSNRGQNLAKFKSGENFLRIILNKDDPENAPFFHQYGIHFAGKTGADGKETKSAHICMQHTFGKACPLCEMVMEGRARAKGNTALENRISDTKAGARFVVVGMLSQNEDFTDVEKTELIDIPQTVFEELMDAISQDISDDIGNPLDRENGYAFKVHRKGTGRDTEYKITPMRKKKMPVPARFWDEQPSLESFVNQTDATKLGQVARMISAISGVAVPPNLFEAAGLPSPAVAVAGSAVASLPGFSDDGVKATPIDEYKAAREAAEEEKAVKSLLEDEISRAEEAVFEAPVREESKAEESSSELDDLERELAALSNL
ncbi:TPA: regulator [Raoultella ornithinolytica]